MDPTPGADGRAARPRLADVAAYAQVSEATVSRVLNGKPGVSGRAERAVVTALDVLGYERPVRLRRTSTGLVGLVVPELTNPIFPAFVQALEGHLSAAGLTPLLCAQTPGGTHEDEYVGMLLERGVAGIVFLSGLHADRSADPGRYRRLEARGLPVVLLNGSVSGLDVPSVSTDDALGVEQAVRHLTNLGHARIGLVVGPVRYAPAARKVDGFVAAMRALHPELGPEEVDDLVVPSFFTVQGGRTGARALLARGVTAIVAASDLMALGAISELRAGGIEVPRDVSVVGFDDSTLVEFTDPPLTTLRQRVGAMAETAVAALLDEMSGSRSFRGEHVFVPELVVRSSTAAAPGR